MAMLQYLVHGLAASAVYGLIALSFALIYSSTRIFHVAHGAVIAVGAYSTYGLMRVLDLPGWVAIPGAVVAGCSTGLLSHILIYKPLVNKNSSESVLTLASFGFYLVLSSIITAAAGTEPKVLRTSLDERFEFMGVGIIDSQLLQLVIATVLIAGALTLIRLTPLDRLLRALGENPELLTTLGFRTNRWLTLVFVLSSALAVAAGQLLAVDRGLNPSMGFDALLTGAVACLLGWQILGHRRLAPIFAAIFIGLLQAIVVWRIGILWRDAVIYVILIAVLIPRNGKILDFRSQGVTS